MDVYDADLGYTVTDTRWYRLTEKRACQAVCIATTAAICTCAAIAAATSIMLVALVR